jgi:hypothetical protein
MKEPINLDIKTRISMAKLYAVSFLLAFLGCKSQNSSQSATKADDLVVLHQDAYSGIDSYETRVITDQKSLNSFYSKINRTRKPGLAVPTLDFSKEMVLIVCAGTQKGSHLPILTKMEEKEKEIAIQIGSNVIENQKSSTALTNPFSVYKMPLTTKKVVFKQAN